MSNVGAVAAMLHQKYATGRVVCRSEEFKRIENLPRRTSFPDLAEALTLVLGKPGCGMPLRRHQAWALAEMEKKRGLIGGLDVGRGKTLITLLAPMVLEAKRPLLLVPASVRDKTINIDIPEYSKHYYLHENLRVLSYEQLSQLKQADILERWMPDLIIADEMQRLKRKTAACTRRVLRYYHDHSTTMFVGVSGSPTKRSLRDYAHLIGLSLGAGSPLPMMWKDLEEWADALDEGVQADMRPEPGALLRFCRMKPQKPVTVFVQSPEGSTVEDEGAGSWQPLLKDGVPVMTPAEMETPREGFCRRLVETEGYVSVESPGISSSLSISEYVLSAPVPKAISNAFYKCRKTMETPGGEIIVNGLDLARHLKELAMGFYYRWKWLNGKKDYEWLAVRRAWKSFVRQIIKESGQNKHNNLTFDTELQVARAAAKGQINCCIDYQSKKADGSVYEILMGDIYVAWKTIKKRSNPQAEAIWISEFMLDEAYRWLVKTDAAASSPKASGEGPGPGILWVEHIAVMDKLRERWPRCYGAGQNEIARETKTCVASMAHGVGKNLQAFDRNLFFAVPSNGISWEQVLGRTHRSGQLADEVVCEVAQHCLELWLAFRQARSDAAYIQQTIGQQQRLQFADVIVTGEAEIDERSSALHADPIWCKVLPDRPEITDVNLDVNLLNPN